ncbi:hypothetical protein TYM08_P2915 [Marinicellulosiphila megalodicopiae]
MLIIASTFISSAIAASEQSKTTTQSLETKASNQSYVPIIAYEGTYGWILGVAYFRYPNKLADNPSDQEFDVLLYAADGPVISLETRWKKYTIAENLDLEIFGDVSNFYVKDYPNAQLEGILIDRQTSKINPKFTQNIKDTHNIVYEFTLDYKDYAEDAPAQYKNGMSVNTGVGYLIDERDNGTNSKKGYMLESSFNLKPHFLSTTKGGTFSTKLELDARYYHSITDKQTFVTRGLFQYTTGNLLDARFGGSKIMRGFDSNRFIGKQALTLQNEYRAQFNKHLGAVGFLSLGQIDTQNDIQINYGIGLRVGLPPDQTQQIRVDFGFDTQGNSTFMLQFNQAI